MKVQIVSDIHLEFHKFRKRWNFITPSAPILCILGDLCCCEKGEINKLYSFFDEIVPHFKLIIWVPGNHEYYQNKCNGIENTKNMIDKRCKKICLKYDNVKFLNNDTLNYPHRGILYRFIGSTLWSYIPDKFGNQIQGLMNDYNNIYVWDIKNKISKKINYKLVNMWHTKSVKYINNELLRSMKMKNKTTYKKIKNIVLTHHKPFSFPSDNIYQYAYESDQIEILNSNNVDLWCYGHTHKKFKGIIGKTFLYSNPKGYPHQKTNYSKKNHISI